MAITLDMPPSVVIRNLQALAESEFVMMDGRRQPESRLVEATEAGREEARQVAEANCNLLSVIVHEWCPDDTSALTALLTRLAEDCSMFRRRL